VEQAGQSDSNEVPIFMFPTTREADKVIDIRAGNFGFVSQNKISLAGASSSVSRQFPVLIGGKEYSFSLEAR
jgi:hypothetical protein